MILFVRVCANPLKILKAIISVATPSEIPTIEIEEINVINFEPFLERTNFLDTKKGNDIKIISDN
jgi:hypothetical protein